MANIRAVITDERGHEIGNGIDFSSSILPTINDDHFGHLRFVDPYGDTVFNRLQIPILIDDLKAVRQSLSADHDDNTVRHLEQMCKKCLEETHLYLKFIGD